MSTVVLGDFNSESFWRDDNLCCLPSFSDTQAEKIVTAMDELLFPLCRDKDTLVTRYKYNEFLMHYLESIGIGFNCTTRNVFDIHESERSMTIFKKLYETEDLYLHNLLSAGESVKPFSFTPYIYEMCSKYSLKIDGPDINVVKHVNSKNYSTELKSRLGVGGLDKIVCSSSEVERIGKEFLTSAPFLIKDVHGVSGKGNMVIASKAVLHRIVKYLKKQEEKGFITRFVLEPLLDKMDDFSCHIKIDKSGEMKFLSFQHMRNQQFAHQGSISAKRAFVERIKESDYFPIVENLSAHLYRDGYWGPVCIDSMILADGKVVPIVEVNARISMGYINHCLDLFLDGYASVSPGSFSFLSIGYTGKKAFRELLEKLEKDSLLFRGGKTGGIIPLSANAVFINSECRRLDTSGGSCKGRFYFKLVLDDGFSEVELMNRVKDAFTSTSFKVFN